MVLFAVRRRFQSALHSGIEAHGEPSTPPDCQFREDPERGIWNTKGAKGRERRETVSPPELRLVDRSLLLILSVVTLHGNRSKTTVFLAGVHMPNLRKNFAKRLQKLRRTGGMTQEELAEKAGISIEFLSNLERGINAPSFETLEKLSLALSISVHFLFYFEDDENNANK